MFAGNMPFYSEGFILESALYVVATPIGNLKDITLRAIEVLADVDLIAAEDTRHTGRLLEALDIRAKLVSLHEHNERERSQSLLDRIISGESVALVSDAGTPLISDPGSRLVQSAHDQGVRVIPVPGPSALVAALSVSGLECSKFVFEGFLPAKSGARKACIEALLPERRAVIYYESPHRIVDTLADMAEIIPNRRMVLARELTKTFETVFRAEVGEVLDFVTADTNQQKGEFVLIVEGTKDQGQEEARELAGRMLKRLADELPPKQVAGIVSDITGIKKNELYQSLLSIQKKN